MQYAMVMISTMITKTQSKWTPEQDQKKKKVMLPCIPPTAFVAIY